MKFTRIYIFSLGIFAIGSIGVIYASIAGSFLSGKSLSAPQSELGKVIASAEVSEIPHQCLRSMDDVKIFAYMFHYIIPDKYVSRDNKIEYGNSIPPEKLEGILQILTKARKDEKIFVANLQELEEFKKARCFPSKNIVLLTVDDGWDDGYNFLFPLAKKYDTKFNLAIIADKVSATASEINNFLNEREIQEMLDSKLITLASHSFSHIELHNQTGSVLDRELNMSKATLEKWFHIPINTIVYPSGKYDDATLKKAKESGYSFGFTTKKGISSVTDLEKNPLTLPRIRINRETNIPNTFIFE